MNPFIYSNPIAQRRKISLFSALLLLVLTLFLQNASDDQFIPNFTLLVFIFLITSPHFKNGLVIAIIIGLLLDINHSTLFGFHIFIYCVLTTLLALTLQQTDHRQIAIPLAPPLVLLVVYEFLYQGLGWLLYSNQIGYSLLIQSLYNLFINVTCYSLLKFFLLIRNNLRNANQ